MHRWKWLLCVLLISVLMVSCGSRSDDETPPAAAPEDTSSAESSPEGDAMDIETMARYKEYADLWDSEHEINGDYIGRIRFDSSIIDLPIVQGETNDTYLRTDWQTMEYDVYGSIFLDYRNTLDDQNLIIYGHFSYPSMDPERTIMFTPLDKLIDKENYEENSRFSILLRDEIRHYKVVYIYYCPIYTDSTGFQYTAEDMQYYRTKYTEEYLEQYIKAISDAEFYSTGESIEATDDIVTLQTCVYDREDLRLIVIAKETGRETIR